MEGAFLFWVLLFFNRLKQGACFSQQPFDQYPKAITTSLINHIKHIMHLTKELSTNRSHNFSRLYNSKYVLFFLGRDYKCVTGYVGILTLRFPSSDKEDGS
jgi:hypothetical protein